MTVEHICLLLSILIAIIYLKWIVIIMLLPFQIINANRRKKKSKSKIIILMSIPYYIVDKYLCRKGYSYYVLYNVGLLPSNHLRKTIYRLIGANIGKDVEFHFRLELRDPVGLIVKRESIIGENALLDARGGNW